MLIVGLGLCTAVGRSVLSSAAAVRAGIAGMARHPYMVDRAGEPMKVAAAPWLDIAMQGPDRHAILLMSALDEALGQLAATGLTPRRCTVVLVVPQPRPGLPTDLGVEMVGRVAARHGPWAGVQHLEGGHAGGLVALQAVRDALERGEADAGIVAAVESWLAPETLEALEADEQLHEAGAPKNPWGFVPGEGAAAVAVLHRVSQGRAGTVSHAALGTIGCATEPCRIKTRTVCVGAGLTQAIRAAVAAPARAATISDLYSDMNGEPYRADEYGFAILRTAEHCADGMTCHTPADCLGDLGAASALALTTLAAAGLRRGLGGSGDRLIASSSEDGTRAAARLTAVPATAH